MVRSRTFNMYCNRPHRLNGAFYLDESLADSFSDQAGSCSRCQNKEARQGPHRKLELLVGRPHDKGLKTLPLSQKRPYSVLTEEPREFDSQPAPQVLKCSRGSPRTSINPRRRRQLTLRA